MLPVVAGALSPDGQLKLKQWQTQMVPCSSESINGTKTIVMRDTGSTTCVVKKSRVKPEQMTGSYELCMLIDGIVKRYHHHHHLLLHHKGSTRYIYVHTQKIQLRNTEYKSTRIAQ